MSDEYTVAFDATIMVRVVDGVVAGATIIPGDDMPDASSTGPGGDDLGYDEESSPAYLSAVRAAGEFLGKGWRLPR
jgi:hypothetical protein